MGQGWVVVGEPRCRKKKARGDICTCPFQMEASIFALLATVSRLLPVPVCGGQISTAQARSQICNAHIDRHDGSVEADIESCKKHSSR